MLTERDLDNILDKMQNVFVPLVTKMIDASMKDLRKDYHDKLDNHKQLISDLAEENDEVSSLQLEIKWLKSRDDELEQYSRRNSLRISRVKEVDKRPTTEIVLEIELKNGIDVTANDIDRSHRVGERRDGSHSSLLVKFTSYIAKKAFMKKKNELTEGVSKTAFMSRFRIVYRFSAGTSYSVSRNVVWAIAYVLQWFEIESI